MTILKYFFSMLCVVWVTTQPVGLAAQNIGRRLSQQHRFSGSGQAHSNESPRLAQDYFHRVQKPVSPLDPSPARRDQVKTVGTNLSAFDVPFQINAEQSAFIEVQLYLSSDRGKTWKFYGRQSTDKKSFPFEASGPGEYWFALRTLDRDRKLLPEGDPQPELKIIVDTSKPELDFRVETDPAGRVVCRWKAVDVHLLPKTLRILYQAIGVDGRVGVWKQVPIQLNGVARVGTYSDQIAWWPETTDRQFNVLAEVKDIAGNVAQSRRQVVVAETGWRHQRQSVARPTDSAATQPNGTGNWKAAEQQRQWPNEAQVTPANQIPANTANQAVSNTYRLPRNASTTGPSSNDHPSNVVCENGVCRVVQAADAVGAGSKFSLPNASSVPGQQLQTAAKQVGSLEEFVAPPVPDGYMIPGDASDQGQADLPPLAQKAGNSVVWNSETDQRQKYNRESVGSTIGQMNRPDSSLAPVANSSQRPIHSVSSVPAPAGSMKRVGDQVVGESSTMRAGDSSQPGDPRAQFNQYRGPDSRAGASLPAPVLLPGEGSGSANAGFKNADVNNSGYRNAGYTNSQEQARQSVVTKFQPADSGPNKIIGSQRFRLDYGIDAIDPSGVARVDLWITRDGRQWSAWGSDPDNQSPFPVEVQEDGRYGFRIVVHSKDGLTGQGPSTGDPADIWILVDTQSPLASITSVPYGRGNEAGRLVVNYSVADDQLTLRPITLSYSSAAQGPWLPIGEGLRNEGRYVWKPQANVPDQIYLRLDALDKAGNIGVHMLSQAIDVSGLVPRGTIRGVSPVIRTK
ncbi:MAG: hypothetical protein ACI87E_003789 [Mariniblastus sp.]